MGLREDLRGNGWFRRFLRRLGAYPLTPPYIFLESVNGPRLYAHATKHWHTVSNEPCSFFLSKEEAVRYLFVEKPHDTPISPNA